MRFSRIFLLSLQVILLLSSSQLVLSQDKLSLGERTETLEDKQVTLLFDKATDYYTNSLKSLDEADVYLSIENLEEIIQRYPDSAYVRNAYFTIADLLTKKIQTKEAYLGAIKAYEDYLARFSLDPEAWEAMYNIASIQYLYLKDYPGAKDSITVLFDEYAIALDQNEDYMKRAKILFAKIMHKAGDYESEAIAYDELEILDPNMNFSYQVNLLKGIKLNRILKQGDDRFIFMGQFDSEFPVNQMISNFKIAEDLIRKKLPGKIRDFPLEIFVYQDSDYFNQTTGRQGSFASGADAQVFYLDGQLLEPIIAHVYAYLISNLASDVKVEFLEVGLLNAFGTPDVILNTAALELGLSESDFTFDQLFDNGKFPMYISERESIAGAFVLWILENYPPQAFYRCFKMMEGSRDYSIKMTGSNDSGFYFDPHRVSTVTLSDGFNLVYGQSFDEIKTSFLAAMAERRRILDASLDIFWKTNPPEKLKILQDSPENALTSYFKAIQAGSYDSLIKCTTGDLQQLLVDAQKVYRDQKILDKVERWKLAIPYMDVRIEVIEKRSAGNNIVIFKVNLYKKDKIMEQKDLVAMNLKGKWYIAEN
jgi:outer membrane protein assembly factor BamD (BamD/ComL family)